MWSAALVFGDQNMNNKALESFERARRTLGVDHPETMHYLKQHDYLKRLGGGKQVEVVAGGLR
jgi:hypothetical protein